MSDRPRLLPAGFGVIIRTEAEERTEEELKQDLDLLLKLWQQIQDRSRQVKAPALIHQDLSLILKTIRETKDLTDETAAKLNAAIEKFKGIFNITDAA